jgi:hypothetical protein
MQAASLHVKQPSGMRIQVVFPGRSIKFMIRCLRLSLVREEIDFLEDMYTEMLRSLQLRGKRPGDVAAPQHKRYVHTLASICKASSQSSCSE